MKAVHVSSGVAPVKYGCGDWVWCLWNDQECRWQVLGDYEDIWRFRLQNPLCRNSAASASLLVASSGSLIEVGLLFTVHDPLGLTCPCCQECTYPPARGLAKYFADSCRWELITVECRSSSSSSSPSSESSIPSSSSRESSSPSSSPSSESSSPSSSSRESSLPSSPSPSSLCPCTGECLYQAYFDGEWFSWAYLGESTCAAPCSCLPPDYEPSYGGEIGYGTCVGPCSSSSPSSPSPSSSEPSSSPPPAASRPAARRRAASRLAARRRPAARRRAASRLAVRRRRRAASRPAARRHRPVASRPAARRRPPAASRQAAGRQAAGRQAASRPAAGRRVPPGWSGT